jgi:hypothetical protein
MPHINLQETRDIVGAFPKVPKRLTHAVVRAYEYVSENYKQIQEKLILQQLTDLEVELYRVARASIDCPLSLFLYLCMGKPVGTCETCGGVTCFRASTWVFQKFCSNACSSPSVIESRKTTWHEKYGADNPSRTVEIL